MEKKNYSPGDTLLGRYKIVKKLGEGLFSVVYEAIDTLMNREVAIKVTPSTEKLADRVKREISTVASLNHPNVVTVYDFVETPDNYLLIMELVRGVTLRQALKRKVVIPWHKAVYVTIQVAEALQEAHQKQIVHRDVKPENIMISRNGRVKLADFGIAVLIQRGERERKASGTLGYMAPEQISGRYVDETSDIFALGVVLYEMLTGKNPFYSDTLKETALRVMNYNPPPPSKANPALPEKLDEIVMMAIGKDPEFRYQSIQQFKEALKELQKSQMSFHKEDTLSNQSEQLAMTEISELTKASPIEKLGTEIYKFKKYARMTFFCLSMFLVLFTSLSIEKMYAGIAALFIPLGVILVGLLYPSAALWLACASIVVPVVISNKLLGAIIGIALAVYALVFSFGKTAYYSPLPFLSLLLAKIGLFPLVFLLSGLFFEPAAAFMAGLTAGVVGAYLKSADPSVLSPYFPFFKEATALKTDSIEGIFTPLSNPSVIYEIALIAFVCLIIAIAKRGMAGKFYAAPASLLIGIMSLFLGYAIFPSLFQMTPSSIAEEVIVSIGPSALGAFLISVVIALSDIGSKFSNAKNTTRNYSKSTING